MRWVALLTATLVICDAFVLSAEASTPDPTVTWSVIGDSTQIDAGSVVHFHVIGPANRSFLLQVTAPPWNLSVPVFQQEANTSNGTNATAVGYSTVQMPSYPYAEQTYQATVVVGGVPAAYTRFALVPALNATNINATLGDILFELGLVQKQQTYDSERLATLSSWQEIQ